MGVMSVDIPGLDLGDDRVLDIRALADERGRSRVLGDLCECARSRPEDHRKLAATLALLASRGVDGVPRTRVSRSRRHSDVIELKGGQIRLSAFVVPGARQVVICTHAWWKAKSSAQEQNEQFDLCNRLRMRFRG